MSKSNYRRDLGPMILSSLEIIPSCQRVATPGTKNAVVICFSSCLYRICEPHVAKAAWLAYKGEDSESDLNEAEVHTRLCSHILAFLHYLRAIASCSAAL